MPLANSAGSARCWPLPVLRMLSPDDSGTGHVVERAVARPGAEVGVPPRPEDCPVACITREPLIKTVPRRAGAGRAGPPVCDADGWFPGGDGARVVPAAFPRAPGQGAFHDLGSLVPGIRSFRPKIMESTGSRRRRAGLIR